MHSLLIQFATSSSGLGALGLNGQAFIIQLITFLLGFYVLRRWAFKPILKIMNDRRETIERGVRLGEQMQQEKAEMEKKVSQALHEARSQADGILSEAQAAARDAIRQAEEKAAHKADTIIQEGKDRGEQEVVRARRALEHELMGLVAEATEVVVKEKVDLKKDAQLINDALKRKVAA